MGFFDFLFGLILVTTLGSVGITYLVGRAAWRGGKRLLGMARERKLLSEGGVRPPQEAQDVVVEPADEWEPESSESWQRPQTPGERARASRQQRQAHESTYQRLDVDAGTTAEKIIEVMEGYLDDQILGERADAVIQTLDSMRRRKQSLSAELDGTFQPGSLSWERFAGPMSAALDAILRNSAQLGNRIQAFDSAAYVRVFKSVQRDQTGGEHSGAQSRAERLRIYQDMLNSLDAIQESNDALLLELDKLARELGDIQRQGISEAESDTLDEIRRLVDEAKYYRNH